METALLMEKRAISPHMLEILKEKRVAKPLIPVMAMMTVMAMMMEFGEVGSSEGVPIG